MPGSIHGLLGENGCGKSTLIKTLSGVQQPDSGQILFNGQPVQISDPQAARQLGIATVFQEFSIVPTLSVGENIFLGNMPRVPFRHDRLGKGERRCRCGPGRNGSRHLAGRDHRQLSVGEQQLVEIAKAVAMQASMIILDEPTAALGEDEIERLHQLLRGMREPRHVAFFMSPTALMRWSGSSMR
jgi:ribose transport system ATP-binding protein